jgi:demethylmenaquinone methyltransferase/2-methoxy-6-polyprenyl-1,4-benzoquinol methylase
MTYKSENKPDVKSMFNSIAWRYDFLNHFLSFSIDRLWRKRAIRIISGHKPNSDILDVATGTADLAIAASKIRNSKIMGIDISENMLEIGKKKIKKMGLSERIELSIGDSEDIPFDDQSFDVVMIGFGIRNFSYPLKGLAEIKRVLRPGGFIMVLEFSKPEGFPFRSVYNLYFRKILPFFGRMVSKNSSAYNYLPDSVMKFPDNERFLQLLKQTGFIKTNQIKLTGGVASIYSGIKGRSNEE